MLGEPYLVEVSVKMMQVSTLYAHSLERQLVSRRNLIQNISRTCAIDKQPTPDCQTFDEMVLSEAGIIPPELSEATRLTNINNNVPTKPDNKPVEVDPKEFTDRLCKLPSQCKGGYILGSPRRHSLSHSSNNLLSGSPSLMKSHHLKKEIGRAHV